MKVTSTSETSVNFYQTTRHYNPEDSHLHSQKQFPYILTFISSQMSKELHVPMWSTFISCTYSLYNNCFKNVDEIMFEFHVKEELNLAYKNKLNVPENF
jgi:hypothetical protein